MKAVAIHVDWPDRLAFYLRLAGVLRRLGWSPVFFTNKLSLHRLAQREGVDSRLLRRSRRGEEVDLSGTREVAGELLSQQLALGLFGSTLDVLEGLEGAAEPALLMIWNGSDVVGEAARRFARRRGLPTVFLELANLPGRLFADPQGVNARSGLTGHPEWLDRLDVDEEAFEAWREDYVRGRREAHPVLQASIFDHVRYGDTLSNRLAFHLLGVPPDDTVPLLGKWVARRRRRKWPAALDDVSTAPYVLFPMQVSSDTQLLINADIDNAQAIERSAAIAADLGCELLVKPHPAEQDPAEIERVLGLRERLGFRLVGGNTFRLIEGARLVVTVNSTVGLEALLAGREARFLGRSFYPHLADPRRMAAYVMGYLLEIDYFGTAPPSVEAVERLLARAAVPVPGG